VFRPWHTLNEEDSIRYIELSKVFGAYIVFLELQFFGYSPIALA
jgi:hypothetical protein